MWLLRTSNDEHGSSVEKTGITGPLDKQVLEACRFVARNIKVRARKDMGRIDLPQFDLAAVLGAVVNAVAHRDDSIHGSKVRLRVYNDA